MPDNPNHDTLNNPYEDIVAAVALIRAASGMLCEHPAATILSSIANELNQERLALLENERGRAFSVSDLLKMEESDERLAIIGDFKTCTKSENSDDNQSE